MRNLRELLYGLEDTLLEGASRLNLLCGTYTRTPISLSAL